MLESVNKIASIVGADRATVQRRADQLGLIPQDGPKQAKLYDCRTLLQLVPSPVAVRDTGEMMTLEEARIRQTTADARVKELQAEKLEGTMADVSELLELQNAMFDDLAARIKKSKLSDEEKEDLLDAISGDVRKWAER